MCSVHGVFSAISGDRNTADEIPWTLHGLHVEFRKKKHHSIPRDVGFVVYGNICRLVQYVSLLYHRLNALPRFTVISTKTALKSTIKTIIYRTLPVGAHPITASIAHHLYLSHRTRRSLNSLLPNAPTGDEERAGSIPGGGQRLRGPPGILQGVPQPKAGPLHPAAQEPVAEP